MLRTRVAAQCIDAPAGAPGSAADQAACAGDLSGALLKRQGVLLPEATVLDWFTQICLGLKHVHDLSILHRCAVAPCRVWPVCLWSPWHHCCATPRQRQVSLHHLQTCSRARQEGAQPPHVRLVECQPEGQPVQRLAAAPGALLLASHAESRRDLKPQNVFMSSGGVLKLGDFGVSRVMDSPAALAKTAIGTPYYISPEIASNKAYNAKARPRAARRRMPSLRWTPAWAFAWP